MSDVRQDEMIAECENNIAIHQKKIDRYNALTKLLDNKEFKLVILDGFITELSEKMFKSWTLVNNRNGISHDEVERKINAVRELKAYLGIDTKGDIEYDYDSAVMKIEDEKEIIKDILSGRQK